MPNNEHEPMEVMPPDSQLPATTPKSTSISPLDVPAAQFREGLERRGANRKSLMEWVRSALVSGTDYGPIHIVKKEVCKLGRNCTNPSHFSKPVLFKPGAEKICGMLGVTVTYPSLSDYEQAAIRGEDTKNVIIRCELISAGGQIVAHGAGARSVARDYGDLNKTIKMALKCLGGKTPVLIKHKNGPIRTDIHRMSQYDTDDLYIAGPNSSWRKVVDIRKQPAGPVRRITTRSGLTVSASMDHRWPLRYGKLVETADLKIGDVLETSQIPFGEGSASEPIAWVAGLFLAQGTIDEPHYVRFHLHANDEDQVQKLISLATSLGASFHDWIQGNRRTFSVSGTAMCGVMRQFVIGELSYGKHFSRWLFRQKPSVIKSALQGYLDGDGYRAVREGRQSFWQIGFTGKNRELADDLRAICSILGYRCKIEPGFATNQTGKKFTTYSGWIKEKEPIYNGSDLGEIVALEDDFQITYEIEVDGDHLFCLANGLVTHNSAHIDATLRMAGLSEIFTQDLEPDDQGSMAPGGDMSHPEPEPAPAPREPAQNAPSKPSASAPATGETPEERKGRFIARLDPVRDSAIALFRRWGWIKEDQELAWVPLDKVPRTKKEFDSIMADIQAFMDGGEVEEKWRAYQIPFGPNRGVAMAELDKKKLFGWWANYKVETVGKDGKPRKPEWIAKDQEFRDMLNAAGEHYEFDKPKDE